MGKKSQSSAIPEKDARYVALSRGIMGRNKPKAYPLFVGERGAFVITAFHRYLRRVN